MRTQDTVRLGAGLLLDSGRGDQIFANLGHLTSYMHARLPFFVALKEWFWPQLAGSGASCLRI